MKSFREIQAQVLWLQLVIFENATPSVLRRRNAHRQHASYKEDGERSGGDLETNDSTLHGFKFQALQSVVHAFRIKEELQSHRASKEELDQNRNKDVTMTTQPLM
ncbi:hypothetical protein Tco_0921119 [Tanacetum coccineum]